MLQIPTSGTAEDIRQLFDVKLLELDHELMMVQVRIAIDSNGVMLNLEDVEGTFLQVTPESEREFEGKHDGHKGHQEVEEPLEQALEVSHSRNKELTDELHAEGGPEQDQERT